MAAKASDYNLTELTTKEYEDHLRATIEFGGNLFVVGRRGTGKTVVAKDVIKSMGHKEIYLNASTMERVDAGGFPRLFDAKAEDYISYMLPMYYKALIEGTQPCVVLLDEIDKTEPALWAPLLEFTQFHSLNSRALPNLKAVVMTGNFASEGGARPCLPLLDRAEKYRVEANYLHWLDWAAAKGKIHPSVTAYVNDYPQDLFGETDPGDLYADSSPRGWENASKMLHFAEKHNWPGGLMSSKVSGCVGQKIGFKYKAYFDHYQKVLPLLEKVEKGQSVRKEFDALEPGRKMVCSMIGAARVANAIDARKEEEVKKGHLPLIVDNVGKFLEEIDGEMALVAIRSQIGMQRAAQSDLISHPSYDRILTQLSNRVNAK